MITYEVSVVQVFSSVNVNGVNFFPSSSVVGVASVKFMASVSSVSVKFRHPVVMTFVPVWVNVNCHKANDVPSSRISVSNIRIIVVLPLF